MKKIGSVPVFLVFLLWLIGGSSAFAQAQEYPTKPIRIIVPLSAGAGADIAARIIAQRMNEHWKQPVIVENRPGAGGQIGTAAVTITYGVLPRIATSIVSFSGSYGRVL